MSRTVSSHTQGLSALWAALIAAFDPVAAAGVGRVTPAEAFHIVLSTGTWSAGAAPRARAGRARGRVPVQAPVQAAPNGNGQVPDGDAETRRVVALVDRARDGDRAAFDQLYTRYLETVYRFILYRVGDVALAEDLSQETFTRALRRINSFTWQGREFAAWLITIARNLVTDHFKASRTRFEFTTGEISDADEISESPETIVITELANASLRAAVQRLSPQQQQCVELRFLHELSVAETAAIMGKNEGAIKTLQYRAMRALQKLIQERPR